MTPVLGRSVSLTPYAFEFSNRNWGNLQDLQLAESSPVNDSPEHRLALAILMDGIYHATLGDIADRRWIDGYYGDKEPFSFVFVCESLDIDPNELRERIYKQWKKINTDNLSVYREVMDLPDLRSGRKPKRSRPKPQWNTINYYPKS